MEYLEGESLARRLERTGALPWQRACRVSRLIADAIAAAHEKNIVHRDLKPANVLLLSDAPWPQPAEVKVLDFGVAKLLAGDVTGGPSTVAGTLIGTPEYMSPEQCTGASVDHRSDIYALGCMLFELIVGTPPFAGESVRSLLTAHKFKQPPALADAAPQAPPWLDRLVARMLAKEPDARPQAMAEVARVLGSADDEPRL
jgi:serine/threonine-protein kinase